MSDKIIPSFIHISHKTGDKNKVLCTTQHTIRAWRARALLYSPAMYLVDKICSDNQLLCYSDNINLCAYSLRQRKVIATQGDWEL